MKTSIWPVACLALVAIGCGPKTTTTASTSSKAPAPAPSAPAPNAPVTGEAKTGTVPASDPMAAITEGQKPSASNLEPTPAKSKGWGPSKMTAAELAQAADDKLRTLKNITASLRMDVEINGGRGTSLGDVAVRDPNAYLVDFPFVTREKGNELSKVTLVANGGKFSTMTLNEGWSKIQPIAVYNKSLVGNPEAWVREYPKFLFTALSGNSPLTTLVQAASKPNSGLIASSEERYLPHEGRLFHQRRLLITRAGAKPISLEFVIDGTRLLPVTARSSMTPKGDTPFRVMWSANWSIGGTPNFTKETFKLPDASQIGAGKGAKQQV